MGVWSGAGGDADGRQAGKMMGSNSAALRDPYGEEGSKADDSSARLNHRDS